MSFLIKLSKAFLKTVIIFICLVVLLLVGLVLYYALTIKSAEDFLSTDFLFFVQIPSLKNIYDNVIDLKAVDVLLTQKEFRPLYQSLLQFKSYDLSRNEYVKHILNLRAYFIIDKNYAFSLVFEPGLPSVITRHLDIFLPFFDLTAFNFKTITKQNYTIYVIRIDNQQLYFSTFYNLIFVSTSESAIDKLYENKSRGQNLNRIKDLEEVKAKLQHPGIIDIYLSTPALINMIFKDQHQLAPLFERLNFKGISLISLNLKNDELIASIYCSFATEDPTFQAILAANPGTLMSLNILPSNASIVSAINIKSFKDIYHLALLFSNPHLNLETIFQQANQISQTLFNLSFDDLLFSWTGEEIGSYLVGNSDEPIIFLKIKDKDKFEKILNRLTKSLLFTRESSLVFNNVRLNRINLPPFLKSVVDLFVQGFEMPYFVELENFLFFCMNPEILANAVNDFKANKKLLGSQTFGQTTTELKLNANVFMYYNLTQNFPPFLRELGLPASLLRLYESGGLSLSFNSTDLKLIFTAKGIAGQKTKPLPSFSVKLQDILSSNLICTNLSGSSAPAFIYLNNNHQLVIQELYTDIINRYQLEADSLFRLETHLSQGRPVIVCLSPQGLLYRLDTSASALAPYPLQTGCYNSFAPLDLGQELLLFNQTDKCFYLFNKQNGQKRVLDFKLGNPVLAEPVILDGILAFYPKSFDGEVYLANTQGQILKGWPKQAGGLAMAGPSLTKNATGRILAAFLTQDGRLWVWDQAGNPLYAFPAQLEGSFFIRPLFINLDRSRNKGIVTFSAEGRCSLLALDGRLLKEKHYPEVADRSSRLLAYDFDADGKDEIFIYGAKDYLLGLDHRLELLPGFPVAGGRQPQFIDLNLDGRVEMLVGGFSSDVYAYELAK